MNPKILNDFADWLKETANQESLQPAEVTHREPDLRTVVAEFTALREEIHRQSRLCRDLIDRANVNATDGKAGEIIAKKADEGFSISVLMEICDRLYVNLDTLNTIRSRKVGFFKRRKHDRELDGYFEGLFLTYSFIIETLKSRSIQVVEVKGKPFDPQMMRAIAVEHQPGSEGLVLRCSCLAYRKGNEIIRFANVVVGSKKEKQ